MKTYKYTIVYYNLAEHREMERQTNSEEVVRIALKKRHLVIDNTTGEEYLGEL